MIPCLEGFSGINTGHIGFIGGLPTLKHNPFQEKIEWLIKGDEGTTLNIKAAGETVGHAETTLTL